MSCCANPPNTLTLNDFLTAKLANMRAFLTPYCATPALKQKLETYASVASVSPFLAQVVPLVKAGQREAVLDTFCAEFGDLADEALRARVGRYIDMFVDVIG